MPGELNKHDESGGKWTCLHSGTAPSLVRKNFPCPTQRRVAETETLPLFQVFQVSRPTETSDWRCSLCLSFNFWCSLERQLGLVPGLAFRRWGQPRAECIVVFATPLQRPLLLNSFWTWYFLRNYPETSLGRQVSCTIVTVLTRQ